MKAWIKGIAILEMIGFMFSFGFDVFAHMTFMNSFATAGIEFRFLSDGQLFLGKESAPVLLGFSLPAMIALIKLQNYDPYEPQPAETLDQDPPGPDRYFDL